MCWAEPASIFTFATLAAGTSGLPGVVCALGASSMMSVAVAIHYLSGVGSTLAAGTSRLPGVVCAICATSMMSIAVAIQYLSGARTV